MTMMSVSSDAARRFVLLLTVTCTSVTAAGQTTQPRAEPLKMVPYADPAFGFELRLPAGWSYDRSRFQQFKNSIGLLSGSGPRGQSALRVMVFRDFELPSFDDWIVAFGRDLAERTNSARVDWETIKIPPRVGAVLTFQSKLSGTPTASYCACIPFDPHTIWVMLYSSSAYHAPDREAARAMFDTILDSLEIHYDPQSAEQMAPALERGCSQIAQLRARAADVRIEDTHHYYELRVDNKAIGYLERRIWKDEYVYSEPDADERYVKKGLRSHEESWRFSDDGTARYTRLDLFSSFDLESELIEHEQRQYPAPGVTPALVVTKQDQVVREDRVLFSSFRSSLDRGLRDPGKPIRLGPAYLDLAWVRVLPGLLLDESEPHAFSIYDTSTRALIAHHIKPLGRKKLAKFDDPVYAFEVQDGFIAQPTRVYVDARGALLKLEAGSLTVVRSTRQAVITKYKDKIDAAKQRPDQPNP